MCERERDKKKKKDKKKTDTELFIYHVHTRIRSLITFILACFFNSCSNHRIVLQWHFFVEFYAIGTVFNLLVTC